nr:alpha/beta hydrolase [Sabulicella rubraurantiaca]
MIALRLVLSDRAFQLRSLTLIEPVAFWLLRDAGERDLYAEIRAVAEGAMAAFEAGDVVGTAAPIIDYWNGPGAWEALPEPVKKHALAAAGKSRWAVALGDIDVGAPLADCERLRIPTLLIRGERTRATTRRILDLLHSAIPDARIMEIPGASHMSPITHPGPVSAAIAAHLTRASSMSREEI